MRRKHLRSTLTRCDGNVPPRSVGKYPDRRRGSIVLFQLAFFFRGAAGETIFQKCFDPLVQFVQLADYSVLTLVQIFQQTTLILG